MTEASPFQPIGGPLPAPAAWMNYGSYCIFPGGVVVGAPPGGNAGAGTINVGGYYLNGVQFQPWKEAPNDGGLYGRQSLGWIAIPLTTDAPSDGNFYGRVSGAWSTAIDMGTMTAPTSNTVQLLRSPTSGRRPPSTRLDGEAYVNFADKQIGVMQGGTAYDMIGVPFFSTTASYVLNQVVNYNNALYSALGAVPPGVWNPAQWTPVVKVGTSAFAGITTHATAALTPSLAVDSWAYVGGLSNPSPAYAYLGSNAYLDQSGTPTWKIGNTSTLGAAVLLLQIGGVYWSTQSGNVTGGANASFTGNYKLWSQADFNYTPVNKAGDTMSGTLSVSGGVNMNGGGYVASGTTLQLYNASLQSCYYVGSLASTFNQFGANPSWTWGAGCWSGFSGGGGVFARSDRTDCYEMGFLWGSNSLVGTISTNGSSVAYNNTSDARLKQNLRALTDELDIGALIDGIRPRAFEWRNRRQVSDPGAVMVTDRGERLEKERFSDGKATDHGFVAQELIKVAPFAVHAPDDGVRQLGEFGERIHTPWGVDASKLMPYVIAELQALRRRVAELEAQLAK